MSDQTYRLHHVVEIKPAAEAEKRIEEIRRKDEKAFGVSFLARTADGFVTVLNPSQVLIECDPNAEPSTPFLHFRPVFPTEGRDPTRPDPVESLLSPEMRAAKLPKPQPPHESEFVSVTSLLSRFGMDGLEELASKGLIEWRGQPIRIARKFGGETLFPGSEGRPLPAERA